MNNKTCRFQYSVSGNVQRIKLATNSKTIKIQQGCLYNLQAMNLTPQYFTDLLKPVAETHNRKLRSSVTGAFAVPRSRSCLIGHIRIQHPNCGIRIRFQSQTSFKDMIIHIINSLLWYLVTISIVHFILNWIIFCPMQRFKCFSFIRPSTVCCLFYTKCTAQARAQVGP